MVKKTWDNLDTKLPLIVENTSWRFIHDFAHFQSCTGVFIFADSSHRVKYIGKTQNNCIVDAIADAIEAGKDAGSTLVKVIYMQFDADASIIANILQEKYLSEKNINSVPEQNSY